MADLATELERLALQVRRAEGPGVAKADGEHPEVLRRRSAFHAEQVQKVGHMRRLGLTQAEIARRMHVSDTHLCKMLGDGHSKGNRFQGEHAKALDEILLQLRVEAVNCG